MCVECVVLGCGEVGTSFVGSSVRASSSVVVVVSVTVSVYLCYESWCSPAESMCSECECDETNADPGCS